MPDLLLTAAVVAQGRSLVTTRAAFTLPDLPYGTVRCPTPLVVLAYPMEHLPCARLISVLMRLTGRPGAEDLKGALLGVSSLRRPPTVLRPGAE